MRNLELNALNTIFLVYANFRTFYKVQKLRVCD